MIRKILKNTRSNVALLVIKMGITFLMTPLIIRALGNYDYGIYEMVISIVGYMGMLDMGLKPAITVYSAKYNAVDDQDKLQKLFSTAMTFMLLIGIFCFLFFVIWAYTRPEILMEGQQGDKTVYALFLLIIGFQLLLSFPGIAAQGFHEGFQRYSFINNITLINSVVGAVILYVLLTQGHGLLALALINALGLSIKYLIYINSLALKRFGSFIFKIKYLSKTTLKELLLFGSKSFIHGASSMIAYSTDAIVIGLFIGPEMIAFYVIPASLIRHLGNLMRAMSKAFMPLFSDLESRGDNDISLKVMIVASRFTVGIMIPILFLGMILGVPFITIWIGPEYAEKGRLVLYLLGAELSIKLISPFLTQYLVGIGENKILAKISPLMAFMNLSLSLTLVHYFEIIGVALGTLIPAFIFTPLLIHYMCKHLGISVVKYFMLVIFPLIVPVVLFISMASGLVVYFKPDNYYSIIAITVASELFYLPFFYLFSIPKEEKSFIFYKIKKKLNF